MNKLFYGDNLDVDIEDIPDLRLPKKIQKLQIVTIQKILDGERINLLLTESVVKSATQHKPENKNQRINFEEDANV